jgi:hypothetical protein
MNITIICDVLGRANNGTSVAAYNLINHLKSQGHIVTVVCCDADKEGTNGYSVVPTIKFGPIVNAALARNEVVPAKADTAKICTCKRSKRFAIKKQWRK